MTLEPTPMPIQEIRKPASFAPITWALLDIFLLASGSLGSTIESDFCPTEILSPISNPSSNFSASNLPSPFTLTSPGTLCTRYALPSSSLSANHSPMLSPRCIGIMATFQVIQSCNSILALKGEQNDYTEYTVSKYDDFSRQTTDSPSHLGVRPPSNSPLVFDN